MSETGKTIALIEALKGNGGGGGSNKFIVTLTPTSLDYSGTMDKTVAEINEAYEAGQEIVFRIYATATLYYDLPCSNVEANSANDYLIMGAFGIMNDLLILFKTDDQDGDGTGQTYTTAIYALTPAS